MCIVEWALALAAVRLDPAPASKRVPARHHRLIADSDLSQDFIPARRAREVAATLTRQAANGGGAAGEDVHRGQVAARVLQLEHTGNVRAVVVFGEAAERNERPGVGQGPAPAIEADHAPEVPDRLELNRLTVQSRPRQPL